MAIITTLPGMTIDYQDFFGDDSGLAVKAHQTLTPVGPDFLQLSYSFYWDNDGDGQLSAGDTQTADLVFDGLVPALRQTTLGSTYFDFPISGDWTLSAPGGGAVIATIENATIDIRLFVDNSDTDGDGLPDVWYHQGVIPLNHVAWSIFAGDDTVTLGDGNDRYLDPDGSLIIDGGDGNDTIFAEAASFADTIEGADTLLGGAGDDWLFSGEVSH